MKIFFNRRMKRITILFSIFALLLMTKNAFSQIVEPKRYAALYSAAEKPLFITREGNTGDYILLFSEWLRNNLRYPAMAAEMGIQGTVHATYIIEKDGSIAEVEILSYPDPVLRREVFRVINAAPRAVPGRRSWNDEPALYATRVLMTAKVHFIHPDYITDDFIEEISDDVDINVTVISFITVRGPGRPIGTPTHIRAEEIRRSTFWQRITRIFR